MVFRRNYIWSGSRLSAKRTDRRFSRYSASGTYIAIGLVDVELKDTCKFAFVPLWVTSIMVFSGAVRESSALTVYPDCVCKKPARWLFVCATVQQ